jgi:basic amino acid/polyamine antiporter, APA family
MEEEQQGPAKEDETFPKERLLRELRLVDAIAIGLGAIIGAGIFVVTGVAAGVAGPAFLVGLVLAGIVATFNALSSAQLAATYPQSGGTYEYGYRVLNPWLGFSAGWMFLASKIAAGGTVALGIASYLKPLFPALPERGTAVGAVVILTVINYFGIRRTGKLNTLIVAFSLGALIYFVISGIPVFDISNLQPFALSGVGGILESAALMFFAYTGYARLATLGEEVADPKHTIPRAIVAALGIAAFLYLAVALVAVGGIGAQDMAATNSPIERAAQAFPLPGTAQVVAVGATFAMFGVLLSQILGISRMAFAMARRNDLPPTLDHVNSYGIPDRGVILTGSILVVVVLLGTLEVIVAGAAFTILLYYSIANLAAIRMRESDRLFPKWVPVLGLVSCLLLAFTLEIGVIGSGIGLLVLGLLLRMSYRRWFTPRKT